MIKHKTHLINKNNIVWALFYLCLATPMFFYIDGGITVGGFGVMYHYLYGIGIVLIAVMAMFLRPDVKKIISLGKTSIVLSMSYIVPVLVSIFIWSFQFASTKFIIKGMFYNVYMLIDIVVAMATVYLLGDAAILLCATAMGLGNLLIIIPAFQSDPQRFIQEFITLVVTFGNDTGWLIKTVEIHDLTFMFGIFLLYALIKKDLKGRWYIIAVTAFFSLTGLKRIAVIGIVGGAFVYYVLSLLPEKHAKNLAYIICILISLATFAYIALVHAGLFNYLEETLHVDTKGRDIIYTYLNRQFSLSPFYMGKGIGFSNQKWSVGVGDKMVQDAFHNEYIRMYVETGFMGYVLWLFFNIFFRLGHFWKTQGKEGGLLFLAILIYLFTTYSSDNTYYYYYTSMALFVLTMGFKPAKEKKRARSIRYMPAVQSIERRAYAPYRPYISDYTRLQRGKVYREMPEQHYIPDLPEPGDHYRG